MRNELRWTRYVFYTGKNIVEVQDTVISHVQVCMG